MTKDRQNVTSQKDDIEKPFMMAIEDVFSIKGRGTIVVGQIARGTLHKGQEVDIVGLKKTVGKATVTGIETFHKELDLAQRGDNVGVLLGDLPRSEVERGMVIAQVSSIKPHKKFKCEFYLLRRDEGGRHKPILTGYRPNFYIRTAAVVGTLIFPKSIEMLMPGDTTKLDVELITPVALEKGSSFGVYEGSLKVGTGHVIQLLD
jgi:elongation factor Tu